MKTNLVPTDQYFASLEEPHQLASAMCLKISEWREWCSGRGIMALWQKKMSNYYGISAGGNSSQAVIAGGSQGELSLIKVNDLHNLIQQQLVTITSQRPTGIARAINSDTQSLKSARIGSAISEYYMSQANFEADFVNAALSALLNDEGFVETGWNKDAGDPIAVDPETGEPEMSGDVFIRVHSPWNVARDPGANIKDQKWFIISFKVNKWDAMAAYPKFADEIEAADQGTLKQVPFDYIPKGSDQIWAHLLIHDRTPAVPKGRYSLMIGEEIVMDVVLPFKEMPLDRMTSEDVIDGNMGYAAANDLMALEEVTDALHSILTSNNVTFGGQSLVGPQGAELKITDIAKGMRYFELPPDLVDKLLPLQMTKSAPETYQYVQMLTQKKQEHVGNVSNVLGQQATQGASGSAMALIQAQAIQFNSGTQRSYFRLMSSVMTKVIFILAKYADTPRVARIVGKSKAQGLKEFKYTGEDLNSISSIVFEMTNAISQTIGGRMQMGEMLLKAGQIKSPKKYINLVTTGNLDSVIDNDESDQLLILEENEALTDGKPVMAVITEMHGDHIKSHMSVLSDLKKKEDPAVVQATLAHIQEHLTQWQELSATNPGLLIATGQQPLPVMQPPMMGMPGQAPGAPGPQLPKMVGGGEAPAQAKAETVNQPNLPTDPATGEAPPVPGVNM